jgi:hypothetical protein
MNAWKTRDGCESSPHKQGKIIYHGVGTSHRELVTEFLARASAFAGIRVRWSLAASSEPVAK